MSRLPLRFKLTLAFTGVMAVLLTGAGIALSLLVASNLDNTIDDGLEARAGDAAALVRTERELSQTAETFAQLLRPDGTVIDATSAAGDQPPLPVGPGPTPVVSPRRGVSGLTPAPAPARRDRLP